MGLFQKLPDIGHSRPAYTLGMHKTVLVVGLGNIGKDYEHTRHNIGFVCVDALATAIDADSWSNKKDLHAHIATASAGDTRVILCKPTTLMNLSGKAVQAISHFYKIAPEDIVVVHDELDINFGAIRTRTGGGNAGHNGIKSISQTIGEGYGRVRIGIGPKSPEQIDSADFVLAKFNTKESQQIKNLTQETTAILTEYIYSAQLPVETRSFIV